MIDKKSPGAHPCAPGATQSSRLKGSSSLNTFSSHLTTIQMVSPKAITLPATIASIIIKEGLLFSLLILYHPWSLFTRNYRWLIFPLAPKILMPNLVFGLRNQFFLFLFVRAVIDTRLITASLWYCLGSLHHERAAQFTDFAGRPGLNDIFAIRVIRATIESTKPPALFNHSAFMAETAFDVSVISRPIGRFGGLVFFNEFTFGIAIAGNKFTEAAFPFD